MGGSSERYGIRGTRFWTSMSFSRGRRGVGMVGDRLQRLLSASEERRGVIGAERGQRRPRKQTTSSKKQAGNKKFVERLEYFGIWIDRVTVLICRRTSCFTGHNHASWLRSSLLTRPDFLYFTLCVVSDGAHGRRLRVPRSSVSSEVFAFHT